MARSLLIITLFFVSLSSSYDYEVIRNSYKNNEITTVYLNNIEVLSLSGSDVTVLKKAYGFISRLIQFKNLRYNPDSIALKKSDNNTIEFLWDEQSLIKLSGIDERLNQSRNNNLDKIKIFLSTIKNGVNNSKITYNDKANSYKGINFVKEMNLSDFKNWEIFPAIHNFLPLGTKIRIYNPTKDWSIVVQVVKNEDLGQNNIIGISNKAIDALGINIQASYAIRTQFL